MVEVYKIALPKDKLMAMPEKERSLMMLLGYASNQISFFAKLVLLSSNKDSPTEMEQKLSGGQTQMSLRILIGVLNEAWELVRKRFLGAPFGKAYRPLLDDQGKESLARLNKRSGAGGLFSDLRNAWIFHHPDVDGVAEEACSAALADPMCDLEWNWYFSPTNYNSFFYPSEMVALHGIAQILEAQDLIEAQQKLMPSVIDVATDMNHVIHAIVAVLYTENISRELLSDGLADITTAPSIFDVWVPFFVEVPNQRPSEPGAEAMVVQPAELAGWQS
jgi:hypothetical protein